MFRSYAESRGLTKPRTFTAALSDFRKDSDSWFDGSVGSVDRRLARCARLLHDAESAAGEDPAKHLAVIAELSADRTALKNLRTDLLNGANQWETRYAPRTAARKQDLTNAERRWVTLESARFYAEQADARHDVTEMAERARRHAEVATSTLGRRASLVTAAFEQAVAGHARLTPKPRTAARKPVFTAFPDSQLFL